jgi:hypothetical protein
LRAGGGDGGRPHGRRRRSRCKVRLGSQQLVFAVSLLSPVVKKKRMPSVPLQILRGTCHRVLSLALLDVVAVLKSPHVTLLCPVVHVRVICYTKRSNRIWIGFLLLLLNADLMYLCQH